MLRFELDGISFDNIARFTPEDDDGEAAVVGVRCFAGSPNLWTLWLVAPSLPVEALKLVYAELGWPQPMCVVTLREAKNGREG